jgi:hypothetical protein
MRPAARFLSFFLIVSATAAVAQSFDPRILRPVGYHPGAVAYYTVPYFADAFAQGGGWLTFTGNDFGTEADLSSAQFDENGYPRQLNSGEKLRAILFGLNANYSFRPPSWPLRDGSTRGRVVVTWKGNADLRLVSCSFSSAGSSGAETGALADGRRVYLCNGENETLQSLEVHAISTPLTEVHVWLPAVDDPATTEKENETHSLEGEVFHPLLLRRLADADWAFIRFMDWGSTNASPQQEWTDRRRPAHAFRTGVLNRRSPGAGSPGDRETGVPFELMVALCNLTGRHLWINVPHLATDDFVTKLAQLIRFGSDGRNPYTATNANPQFAPLRSDLKVFVEYSNEIWSNGFSFPQGDWAEGEAESRGLSRAQFNARRFSDTWRLFQQVFGGNERLVRVAAIFTGLESYTRPFLQELGTYGTTLSPPVRPDVMALTTYFGNGVQDFVVEKQFAAGKLFNDPYWQSALFATQRQIAFDEWKRRILAGDTAQGGGFDTTGVGGGFATTLRTLPQETLGYALPIVAYEGGPSLYTDSLDSGASNAEGVPTDDFVTTFIEAMNRDATISNVYDIHLNLAKQKGLRTHTPYTDAGLWSKYGQWGHLEIFEQRPADSPKYSFIVAHASEFAAIRSIDEPLGDVPRFDTAASLAAAVVGTNYFQEATTAGGNGARTTKIIGTYLDPSLTASISGDRLRIVGTPSKSQKNYVYARVTDADGDPAWRIFTFEAFGGPGTLVQSDFRGASPALATPWLATHVRDARVNFGGWRLSSSNEISAESGDDAFTFSVNGTADDEEPLSRAIEENEYLTATITPTVPLDLRGAELRFSIRRIDFHSPTGYALSTSLSGFTQTAMLFVGNRLDKGDFGEREEIVTLPATPAYAAVTAPLEIRIYTFGAQFEGHRSSLTGFKLTQRSTRHRPVLHR